jgi:hypothetical protein
MLKLLSKRLCCPERLHSIRTFKQVSQQYADLYEYIIHFHRFIFCIVKRVCQLNVPLRGNTQLYVNGSQYVVVYQKCFMLSTLKLFALRDAISIVKEHARRFLIVTFAISQERCDEFTYNVYRTR